MRRKSTAATQPTDSWLAGASSSVVVWCGGAAAALLDGDDGNLAIALVTKQFRPKVLLSLLTLLAWVYSLTGSKRRRGKQIPTAILSTSR